MPLWGVKFKPADDGGEAGHRLQEAAPPRNPAGPADGLGPALESHLGTKEPQSGECESREALEITLLQHVTTSPPAPSGVPPPRPVPKTCGLVASGTHLAAFPSTAAAHPPAPGGASTGGSCLTNAALPLRRGSSNSPAV